MATRKALDGKPYAENPHVWFDEGDVAPATTPRRGSLRCNVTRRNFFADAGFAALAATAGCCLSDHSCPARGGDMFGFMLPPMDEIRFGFIGLNRGGAGVRPYSVIPNTRVTALCDINPEVIARRQAEIAKCGRPPAKEYTGSSEAWKRMADDPDVDFVIVGTPWALHTPMATYLMEHGKHVGVEVPAAVNIEECWRLVETSERTRCVCMQLENRCYNETEMMMGHAIRKGALGEVVYAECGYIHDIRSILMPLLNGDGTYRPYPKSDQHIPVSKLKDGMIWRGHYDREHGGNAYPTHGIGPIAQILGINRGDRFDYLTSVDSCSASMRAYAEERYGVGSPEAKAAVFKMGDRNVSLIRTANGKLISLSHNVVTPRPGSRLSLVEGTRGAFTCREAELESEHRGPDGKFHALPSFRYTFSSTPVHSTSAWSSAEGGAQYARENAHPLWRDVKDLALKLGGHGGQDFMMFLRIAYCLHRGLPLDQDVYDLASWSSIVELSERSADNRGRTVDFPDFTRGGWKNRTPLTIGSVDAEYLAGIARAAEQYKLGVERFH